MARNQHIHQDGSYPPGGRLGREMASPPAKRRRTLVFQAALALMLLAFALLAALARRDIVPLDVSITRAVQSIQYPMLRNFMEWVSWLGYAPQSVIITILAAALLFAFGLRAESLVFVAAISSEQLLNLLVKAMIHRPRPSADLVHVVLELDSYSFPSGHVMFYTCFFGLLLFWSFVLLRSPWLRVLFSLLFGVPLLLVGLSRVYLGEHWASDTLAAYLLGGVVLMLSVSFYRRGKPRFFARIQRAGVS